MGLDTTHDAYHGPYSTFNQWRYWVANQLGLNLDDYEGYMAGGKKDLTTIDHPLMVLFNHSDCDGKFTPEECRLISKGLKSIIDNYPKSLHYTFNLQTTIQFRKGCIRAANANEDLIFT